jgi:two-component system, chemotaxis family, chemotaxis protein CheY
MEWIKAALPLEALTREIMAVDGSTTMFKVYERVFNTTRETKGFRLVNFTSGRIALDWMDQNPERIPSAILLDRHMEGFSGLDMLKRLKAEDRWKAIPVIMVSYQGEQAHVVEAIKGGASDFMVKPLQSGVLAAKLLRAMAIRESAAKEMKANGSAAQAASAPSLSAPGPSQAAPAQVLPQPVPIVGEPA